MPTVATTWKFAVSEPGRDFAQQRDSAVERAAPRLRSQTGPRASERRPTRPSAISMYVPSEHREAGGRAAGRLDRDRAPVGVRREQPPQPLVRPAPVVLRRGVVHLDAVRRGEHASAGSGHAVQLAHRLRRVVAVLEHLRAEDEVERAVLDGQRLDAARRSSAAGFATTSTPTYSLARSAKKG